MGDFRHALWRVVPHRLRRAAFDRLSLVLAPRLGASPLQAEPPFVVAGAFGAPTGLGEAARLTARGLMAAGQEVRIIDLTEAFRQSRVVPVPEAPADEGGGRGTLILVTNPPVSSFALSRIGRSRLQGRRRIGSWVWEYPDVPPSWRDHATRFDEVRAPTRFAAEVLASALGQPVALWPYPVALNLPADTAMARPAQSRTDLPTLGFAADTVAAFARKNVYATLTCARRLVAAGRPVRLSLLLRGGRLPEDFLSVAELARAEGVLIDIVHNELTVEEMERWWRRIDIYMSLHHAEGFGLTVAEAMARGIPVVATDVGATVDFCDADTGWPVASRMGTSAPVFDLAGPSTWRVPDVDDAVRQVMIILASPQDAADKASRGKARLVDAFGVPGFLEGLHAPRWIESRSS
jgi:glycosyltransferase involved in cell wall biosynthesis